MHPFPCKKRTLMLSFFDILNFRFDLMNKYYAAQLEASEPGLELLLYCKR